METKNTTPESEAAVVDPAILRKAKLALKSDQIKPVARLNRGSESAPNSTESLCWVCRRLKLSVLA